jgi:phosphoglycerate dehydrogenase-like enzyme
VRDGDEAAKEAADADAVLGYSSDAIVKAGSKLRWIQINHAGIEKELTPALVKSDIVLTNTARIYGPNVADSAMALLLSLTRGIAVQARADVPASPSPSNYWEWAKKNATARELHGKTMLIVGFGGIGTQVARRADAFGMRVMAVDPNESIVRPQHVFSLDRPAKLMDLLPKADVVVMACPLTKQTRGMIDREHFAVMKKSALFINVARGGLVNTDELVAALKTGGIAGAGLDVTDPEPLPNKHVLWTTPNVAITPHLGGQSPEARDRQWRLLRENVRRFVAGEPLLCVVDKQKGY